MIEHQGWTLQVRGNPRGGVEALVERFVRGGVAEIGAIGGPWSLHAQRDGRVWVAVDAFAGVPLFVTRDGRIAEPRTHRGPLDPAGIEAHLAAAIPDPSRTLYADLIRVPAGFGGPVQALARIWRPVPTVVEHPAEALREALSASVEHLRTPTASVALSGGLDSSVVASFLPGAQAVTNRFPGWTCDEGAYAEQVARLHGLSSTPVDSTRCGPADLDAIFAPPAFPPLFVNHYLNLALLQAATGPLWTGFGGDEVVGHGSSALQEWGRQRAFRRLWTEALHLALRERIRPEDALRRSRRWIRSAVAATLARPGRGSSPRERRLRTLTHPYLQRSREEQAAMAAQVGRPLIQPFLDAELGALSLSIPDTARVDRGRTRWVLRQAFWDELPPAVRNRRDKANLQRAFDEPFGRWLPGVWPIVVGGILDPWRPRSELEALRRRFDLGDHLAGAALWRAYGAARWLTWHTTDGG